MIIHIYTTYVYIYILYILYKTIYILSIYRQVYIIHIYTIDKGNLKIGISQVGLPL